MEWLLCAQVINLQGAILALKDKASAPDRFALNLTSTKSFEYKSQSAFRQRTFFLEADNEDMRWAPSCLLPMLACGPSRPCASARACASA